MTEPFNSQPLNEQEIAAMRWKAVEAANSMAGISPMARRLLIALVCAMDNKTRECFPSELWLASYLGVNIRSVRAAKEELRKVGAISWTNPEGPRHRSRYDFNWEALEKCRDAARAVAKDAVVERRQQGRQTLMEHSQQGRQTLNERDDHRDEKLPNRVFSSVQQGQLTLPTGSPATSNRVTRPSEQPYRTAELEQPNHITPPQAVAEGDDEKLSPIDPLNFLGRRSSMSKEGIEGDRGGGRRPSFTTRYPALVREFCDDKPVMSSLRFLSMDQEDRAARALAMQGRTSARDIIMAGIAAE